MPIISPREQKSCALARLVSSPFGCASDSPRIQGDPYALLRSFELARLRFRNAVFPKKTDLSLPSIVARRAGLYGSAERLVR